MSKALIFTASFGFMIFAFFVDRIRARKRPKIPYVFRLKPEKDRRVIWLSLALMTDFILLYYNFIEVWLYVLFCVLAFFGYFILGLMSKKGSGNHG